MISKAHTARHMEIADDGVKQYRPDKLTIETQAAPGDQPLRHAESFLPILGNMTPMIDVQYVGERTIEGNAVVNAPMDAPDGNLFHTFDLCVVPVSFQYNNLKLSSRSPNDEYNRYFVDQSLPTIAAMKATQLTDMEFLTYEYLTDISHMSGGDSGKVGYAVWAQSMWQSYAMVPAKLDEALKKQNWMLERCTDIAEPQMTLLNGQFMRKTLLSVFRGLFSVIKTGYLDVDWFREVNALNISPYCKEDGANACYAAITGSHIIPNLTVKESREPDADVIFDFATDETFQHIVVSLNLGGVIHEDIYDFQALIQHIIELLEPAYMVRKARLNAMGNDDTTLTYYVNDVIASVQALIGTVTKFREIVRPLLAIIERLEDVGNVFNWVKGMSFVEPTMPRQQDYPARYMLTKHIVTSLGLSGSMVYDEKNSFLHYSTIWRKDEGVPKYDLMEGGISLATSVRTVDLTDAPDVASQFPVMFLRWRAAGGSYINHIFINRRGDEFRVDLVEYSAQEIANNPFLRTLQLGNDAYGSLRVPTVTLAATTTDTMTRGKINDALITMFGLCNVKYDGADHFSKSDMLIGLDVRNFRDFVKLSQDFCDTRSPLTKFSGPVFSFFKLS